MKRNDALSSTAGDPMETRAVNEIGLDAEQAQRIALFSVDRVSGRPSLKVRASDLGSALEDLPADVQTVAFVDKSAGDDGLLLKMVTGFAGRGVHGLTWHIPATSAVKRVEAGCIEAEIDRETLCVLRAPEVLDRQFLERAVSSVDDDGVVNPIELVASSEGTISLFEADWLHS